MTKIVFAGTPEFAVPSLEALCDASYDVVAVYTQPDRPSGRGRKLKASPVKKTALDRGLSVLQPKSLRTQEAQQELQQFDADLMVVAAYGLILPAPVLEAPRLGCVNVHASLLPRWRGAAPVQRSILAGDDETGITIMQMDIGLDTGDMLQKTATKIGPTETAGELTMRLAKMGSMSLIEQVELLFSGNATATPQNDDMATYAAKIQKTEAALDFAAPVATLDRQVRGFNPWPTAFCYLGPERLKIWQVQPKSQSVAHPPGYVRVEDNRLFITALDGEVEVLKVQAPGSRAMSAGEFLNARNIHGQSVGSEAP